MKELIYEELLLLYFLDIVGSFSNLNLWSVSNIWSISLAIVLPQKKKSAIVQVNSNCYIYIYISIFFISRDKATYKTKNFGLLLHIS